MRACRVQTASFTAFEYFFRYYFDGAGKAVRPVIAVCIGKAALKTTGVATNREVRESSSDSCNFKLWPVQKNLEAS